MNRSLRGCSPVVVTLLTPSPAASQRVKNTLSLWVGLTETNVEKTDPGSESGDALDRAFRATPFSSPILWDSVALTPFSTGTGRNNSTLLHLLSPKLGKDRADTLALLAVQQASSVDQARSQLAEALPRTSSKIKLAIGRMLGQPMSVAHLLGSSRLPLLQWSKDSIREKTRCEAATLPPLEGELKEIVIPAYNDSEYEKDPNSGLSMTLFSKLSRSPLERPATGLYRFPGSQLCLRPIPSAKEDRNLAPPSLIFHVKNLESTLRERQKEAGDASVASRIGYTGTHTGQVMLRHPSLAGLDVRFCESTKRSSMFAEAQESLLAGSLAELQSQHVLDASDSRQQDPRMNHMDCWVEFRANIKNPSGFVHTGSRKPRIAKAPDLPYQ